MRLLLISDTHGHLEPIDQLARDSRADAVVHAGDFGFYDDQSVNRLGSRELFLRIVHSDLRAKVIQEPFPSKPAGWRGKPGEAREPAHLLRLRRCQLQDGHRVPRLLGGERPSFTLGAKICSLPRLGRWLRAVLGTWESPIASSALAPTPPTPSCPSRWARRMRAPGTSGQPPSRPRRRLARAEGEEPSRAAVPKRSVAPWHEPHRRRSAGVARRRRAGLR
jgi:hypothetical protein